ncbi:MAG: transcriptional repressor [Candidatus Rokubacteria bacterium]|nr:transcriptional repressor [Candidatus Rokubacteria bacterium]
MTTLEKGVAGKRPIDPLAARLRNAGLRVTAQRLGVLQVLKASHIHPTAEAVHRQVRKRFPKISLNTVYLNLEALTRVGETSEVWIGHDAARFEANSVPHDHAVCVRCKKIADVHDPALRRLKMPRGFAMKFDVISHRVDFFGLCKTCRVGRRRNKPRSYRGT